MENIKKRIFYFFFIAVLLLLIAVNSVLFYFDYDSFCRLILASVGKLHKLQHFQEGYFKHSVFLVLRIASVVFSGLFLFCFILFTKKIQAVFDILISSAGSFFLDVKLFFENTFRSNPYLVFYLLVIAAFNSYNCFTRPFEYDESWTAITYVRNGALTCISYYITPNNHIFYTLLCSLVNFIKIDLIVEARLINMLASLFIFTILFRLLKEIYNEKIGLISSCIFSFLYPVLLYSFFARGYAFLILFTLIEIYSIWRIQQQEEKNSKFYWKTYVVSTILGFYTMPSFLYPFITVNVFILLYIIREKKTLIKLIINNIIIGITVLILYTPIFLINGVKAVTSNRFVAPKSMAEINARYFYSLRVISSWLIGFNKGVIGIIFFSVLLLGLIAGLFFLKDKKHRAISVLAVIMLLLPLAVPLVQHVFPFPRNYIYLTLGLILTLSSAFYYLFKYFRLNERLMNKIYMVHGLSAIIIILSIINFTRLVNSNYNWEINIRQVCSHIALKQVNTMYSEKETFETLVLMYIYDKDYKKSIAVDREGSNNIYADDVIILDVKSKIANQLLSNTRYSELYHDNEAFIFVKKDLMLSK